MAEAGHRIITFAICLGLALFSLQFMARYAKRHSPRSGVSYFSQITGLPARLRAVLFPPLCWLRLVFPFWGPLLGGNSCRIPGVAQARWGFDPAAIHHWRPLYCNWRTFFIYLLYLYFMGFVFFRFLYFGSTTPLFSSKNCRRGPLTLTLPFRNQRWHWGQKCVPRPATSTRSIGVWQRRQGWPVRW